MSITPPPGWYRDPSAPHQERWWDGTAWTEHRRAPEGFGPVAAPVPGPPSAVRGGGRARAVALAVTGAVLVAAVVTGAVLLREDPGGGERTAPPASPPTAAASSPPPPSSPSPSPSEDPSVVVDELNGITLPLPDGWVRPEYVAQDDVVMTTDGTYDCPVDPGVCRRGLVISRTVTDTAETSPKVLAEADIADAAELAYGRDTIGRRPFGGIESHRVVAFGQVAVASRAGYYVRWRVTTAEGPGGYVQSLVFPSTVGTEAPVLVRFVFDAGEDGPPLADMDRITKGIRPIGDADTGGGVGSGIGRTP
ncbi:membrane protein [Streptomyces sp. A012304]|nr:membrane protein [Streptomyces sp. A012304]